MSKKCTKTKHFPNWEDYEVAEYNENMVSIHCNCECWGRVYQRDYIFNAEGEVDI